MRVAPYLADVSEGARSLVARRSSDPVPVWAAIISPAFAVLRHGLSSVLGGTSVLELRLRQAGSGLSVEAYRSRQLVGVLVGAVTFCIAAIAWTRLASVPGIVVIAAAAVGGVAGLLACDYVLQRRANRRMARLSAELPLILEFLTLSLSAGEGVVDAIRRVSRVSAGELSHELSAVLTEVSTGLPLASSLDRCARELQLPAFTRCVDQLTIALERGSPLAEVLRAQAQDARDDTKRHLLEVAGKKEVAMLIPLVFLILPTTILFAIFPGVFVLQVGF
ncbi:type II secretion system F family protein [Salinibacterium hongtaonis]|uniref:Pilus assembly protein n=1 Tax=Homoserinimonas hongtaonis TaxID=2079791 RepID=A0A2U1SX30_9MICO|nr:type II secretion system F family protein [Salinibacterium hongtaonis]AWB88759.1 pilus assembly protein [Salinibacterium hongtaonis]PWB96159.1 pilus assembly protein [Salinibacterium hongtaonis]